MFDFDRAASYLMLAGMFFLAITIFFCLFFSVRGPRLTDKILAANMIGVKTIILVIMVGVYMDKGELVDIALVFAFISSLGNIVFARLILQYVVKKSGTDSHIEDTDRIE